MLFDKYWNYTTCIEYDSLDILESSIIEILEQEEGCQRIFELPESAIDWQKQKRSRYTYLEQELSDLWIVAIFPGCDRWSVIKTFPTGLICDRSLNSSQLYLTNLTKQIKCNAFHLEIQDSVGGFLFESNSLGNTCLSGCSILDEIYDCGFHDETKVDKKDLIANFCAIDVPESFEQAIQINESPEVLKQEQKIAELDPEDPEYFDLAVDKYIGHTQRIDLAFADLFDPNRDYWFLRNSLVARLYNPSDRSKLTNAKILYFQPPTSYIPLHIRQRNKMKIPQTTSSPEENILFVSYSHFK